MTGFVVSPEVLRSEAGEMRGLGSDLAPANESVAAAGGTDAGHHAAVLAMTKYADWWGGLLAGAIDATEAIASTLEACADGYETFDRAVAEVLDALGAR